MQHIRKSIIFSLVLFYGCLLSTSEAQDIELSNYLPNPSEIKPWQPEDEARTAEGETLFMLINGAAELYFEYGFQRAIFQSYVYGDEQWIDVEVYEMEDAGAAYGLQSFKRGQDGKQLDIGQDAFLEEYYLNFWKSNVQVSVVGQDDSEETIEALIQIAKAIETNIPGTGELPELAGLLENSEFPPQQHIYIKGPLGLLNHSPLEPDALSGFSEGLVGKYEHFTLFLLQYASEEAAATGVANAHEKVTSPSSLKAIHSYVLVCSGEEKPGQGICKAAEELLLKNAQ